MYKVIWALTIATRFGLRALIRIMIPRPTVEATRTTRRRILCHRGCLLTLFVGLRTLEFVWPLLVVEVWFSAFHFNITLSISLFKTKSDIDELIKCDF